MMARAWVVPRKGFPHRRLCATIAPLDDLSLLHWKNDSSPTISTLSGMAAAPVSTSSLLTTSNNNNNNNLLHTDDFAMTLPAALSPSSIACFRACPQAFLFQYVFKLPMAAKTPALATGSMCHAALDEIFGLPPANRTRETLHNLFRRNWARHRTRPAYQHLFHDNTTDNNNNNNNNNNTYNRTAEREWGLYGLRLLDQYWDLEDPSTVPRPNPVQREIWVRAQIPYNETSTFLVRGIIDRIDMVWNDNNDHHHPHNNNLHNNSDNNPQQPVALQIVDYKTGKAPRLKYSRAVNDRIQAEAMEQLLIYALLHQYQTDKRSNATSSLPLRYLRLLYLTSHDQRAQTLDWDLGATAAARAARLQDVERGLVTVWEQIVELVDRQDPAAWKACQRPFCDCHARRAQFRPGLLDEP